MASFLCGKCIGNGIIDCLTGITKKETKPLLGQELEDKAREYCIFVQSRRTGKFFGKMSNKQIRQWLLRNLKKSEIPVWKKISEEYFPD